MKASTASDTLYLVQKGDEFVITNDYTSYKQSVTKTITLRKTFRQVDTILKWRKGIDKNLFRKIPVFIFPKKNTTVLFQKMVSSFPQSQVFHVPKRKKESWTETELKVLHPSSNQKQPLLDTHKLYLVRRKTNFVITNDYTSYKQSVTAATSLERTFKNTQDISMWRKGIDKVLFRKIPVFLFPQLETTSVFNKMLLSFSKKQCVRIPKKEGNWTEKELLLLYSQTVHEVNNEKKGSSRILQQQSQDALSKMTQKTAAVIASETQVIQNHVNQVQWNAMIRKINKQRKLPLMSYLYEEVLLSKKKQSESGLYLVQSKTAPSFFTNSKRLATFARVMDLTTMLTEVATPEEAYMVSQNMIACLWVEGTPPPTHVPQISVRHVKASFIEETRLVRKSRVETDLRWATWMKELEILTTLLNKKFPMKSRALVQQLFGYAADSKQVNQLSFQKGSEKRMNPNGYVLVESDFAPPFAVRTKGVVSEFKKLDPMVKLTMIQDSEEISTYISETPVFVETDNTVRPRWYPTNRTISLYGLSHEKIPVSLFIECLRRMASTPIDANRADMNNSFLFMKTKNSIEVPSAKMTTVLTADLNADLKILKKLSLRQRPLPKRPLSDQSIRLVTDAGGGASGKHQLAGAQIIIGTHGVLSSVSMTTKIYSVEAEMNAVLDGLTHIYDNGLLAFNSQKRIDVLFDITVYVEALNTISSKEMANQLTPSALGELYQYVTNLRLKGIKIVFHDIKDHSDYQSYHDEAHDLCTKCFKKFRRNENRTKNTALV